MRGAGFLSEVNHGKTVSYYFRRSSADWRSSYRERLITLHYCSPIARPQPIHEKPMLLSNSSGQIRANAAPATTMLY